MNQGAIAWAMSQGAPITCATCRLFHEGNMRCGKVECGGPAEGKDFPHYDGPIPREKFIERCLVCGDGQVSFHIVLGTDKTKYGLCRPHRSIFAHIEPATPDKLKHPVTLIAVE